ncbi:tRNA dimethylallyltransferase [Frankia sp. Hr75.2]|uniref:tRNA dimethylallyltransferase n=1 Tax=Parafrankia sp. (strain EAN1pec) TaxID=298653 RepID=MIAA_PARS2|nr:RecName: Full=tRNA dimethylallyltransferase; AltName: Full=Dimethylallyl diphosphate:tRNA dimethylallyltransferase; Short=DMAPP:tRNA dimethylallyltransferase; Short=DMATase; AltName: Full=Isopentenyl-diphosphate:tRNA isopentenyltransferase; Short=IPP transferase; Short=IPPT; Short=IPTase [Frankia sp. EAN1pec]ABW10682.1 tRNA delta(2)-isopentenylpyrophosphate transferase [Frankia sp. EAN1pec]CAI7978902.1 tRNA dimethylallyltransferase [Frankia sp. Hr75.2]
MTASRDGAGLTNGATRADQAGPVIAVVGPTGAGKSDLAVEIALELGGEIVNADSMQLYRGMDIGTAKIPMVERRGVPHHLLDVWEITRAADVASYQADARRVVNGLLAAGRVPILVGGSGLYVRAVLDDLSFPGTDPAVRARLERELAEVGPGPLHERLTGLAPTAAAAILPGNGRRIVRALEVVELTGTFEATLPEYRSIYDVVQVGVDRPDLDTRIADRVELMWRAGFVDEVAALAEAGLRDGRTASRALGYAQVLAVLDGAMDSMDAAKQATTTATRRFARRQRSWFRRDPRISWLEFPDVAAALAEVRRLVGSL